MVKTYKLVLNPISKIRMGKGLKKQPKQHTQVSFASYTQSIRELTETMHHNEKKILSRFFVPPNTQKSNQKGSSSLIKSYGSSSQMSKDKSPLRSREQIINQHFVSEVFNNSSKSNIASNSFNSNAVNASENEQMDNQQFTNDQKESLKNAFRYICRLIFKQAHKYSQKMNLLESLQLPQPQKQDDKKQIKKSRSISRSSMSVQKPSLSDLNLAGQAQLISGQRYFKQYLQKLSPKHKQKLLKYMIWFLKTKYLRYINKCNNENKGKRKQMKKDLYIRFKNTTMLPYLEALLIQQSDKNKF